MKPSQFFPLAAALAVLAAPVDAAHHRVFVLTGQSNSLGTTNGTEADVSPGSDPADPRVKFFWHNVADAATSLGSSGGAFTPLQAQQGNYYPGSASHWGPEIGFGRTLVRAGVENVAIIKASRGGGGNTNWSEAAGGHMYSHLVTTVNAATAAITTNGDTFEIAGLLYFQGESDSAAEADIAGTRFQELVDNLRADLPNAANMKAVIGGIAAAGSARDTVRARHETLAAGSPDIDFFPDLDLQAQVTDGLHFNKAAKLRIGERFAQAFFANGTVTRRYGKLVFIGDSITQGGNGDHPSYRYQVFKRLAEQGVPIDPVLGYKFTGSVTGPQTTAVLTTPNVNGQVFENVHDGHYGWRASWINARVRLPANRRSNNRGEGTLLNWSGQAQPQDYDISGPDLTVAYPDPTATGTGNTGTTYIPDTASVMIGINDLGDDNLSANQVVADLGTIVDQLRAANPNVRLFLNRLLYTNQTQAMRDAVDAVNAQLPTLAAAKNAASATSPLWIIDAYDGFTAATMTYDAVHPNAAGEVHVGDRVAAALGVIESPLTLGAAPPHEEKSSADFDARFEGHEIWNGSSYLSGWAQSNELTESLPAPTDLRLVHPATSGRWLEGTNAGWSALAAGSWTFETRLKCNVNANGFVLWLGTGTQRIIVEIHGNRTLDLGGESFNVAHDNLDGNFHVFRVNHDAANARYHVFRDNIRLTPLAGATYDQTGADSRLILGDYTSGTFGNAFDITLDHVRFTPGAWLPPGLDSDSNGMSDAWEYLHFATLTGIDPAGNPDEDPFTNLQEFQNGTDPVVADVPPVVMRTFLLTGGGNARGFPSTTVLNSPPPGSHPAEQAGGVWFHNGSGWTTLAAAGDGTFGPETAFARLLWDAGYRGFGIVKSTTTGGGNSLWQKGSPDDSAYDALVATATAAAATPPAGIDSLSFTALLHIQGEGNDATEAAAADVRFATLLDDLKADLPAASGLNGILGEIGGSGANRDTTRSRHSSLAAARADIGLARATGLAAHNLDGQGIHYGADSLFLLGARMAAEGLDLNLLGAPPLPSWSTLHAWFVADNGVAFDGSNAVTRWANLRNGSATRDLARRVAGQVFRRDVTAANGQSRKVMLFDGTNDLWSNGTTEFGAITGPRSIALLCRITGNSDGFLFDGTTGTGRTRAQVRAGRWQAGVTPSAGAWNTAEPETADRQTATWQRHVFTYQPGGSGGTTVQHWIDGILVETAADADVSNLGGLILGSNGGSPFTRVATDLAEVAVYNSLLTAVDIAALDSAWTQRWGAIAGPPFSSATHQTPREIPRFGRHPLLELAIAYDGSTASTLTELRLQLAPGTRAAIDHLVITTDDGTPLAMLEPPGSDTLAVPLSTPLLEGENRLIVQVEPRRHAALGTALDASVTGFTLSGGQAGDHVPDPADPPGSLTLGLVPLFTDVVKSGDLGIHTFRIPGITIDGQGVMHAVYDHRYTGSGDLPANVDVGYSRSTDGGATWTTSQVIMDFDAAVPGSSGNGVGDPCILHDPVTDTLWVAALWSFGNNGYNGSGPGTAPADTGQYVLAKSEDGGDTWSAPINVTAAVKDDPNWNLIFQGPGHGLALRDGTLVFPSQYRDAAGTVRVCSVFSSDHGLTWDFGSGVPTSSPQTNENTACELDDGRLLFSMRTPSGSNGQRAWIRYSPGGTTPMRDGNWDTLFRLPSVPDPVCQGSVIQWTSTHRGDPREFIVFGNPASSSSRVNFTLRVSPDGGDSWPVSRLLYAGLGAYSSICILPDRSIGVLFEKDNYTRITFARVEEAWLMNPAADADGDGIPDAWEILHGLNPALDDSILDPDGDGHSNSAEHAAGTNPLDAVSALGITAFSGDALTWRSVPGRSYAVEESGDLSNWETLDGFEAITASGPSTSANLPAGTTPSHFYRVRVLP